ncbi:SDR family oxidoreductase [Kibdelosporangium philippinense]|uniref:SDR family oxidoreductase n=1 Tax=Kibdelosporangium philippinense TaxID=211113 RepID=UPI003612355F
MVAVKEFEARGVKAAAFQSDQADASSAPQLIDDVIAIIRAAAPMIRDGGRIINIGSGIASRAGGPGFADYAATKAGIVGYTKGAARDLASRGITVNMLQAGLMDTAMTPPSAEALDQMVANLSIEQAETASVVTFLAGPGAGYSTGAVIDSNGGHTA